MVDTSKRVQLSIGLVEIGSAIHLKDGRTVVVTDIRPLRHVDVSSLIIDPLISMVVVPCYTIDAPGDTLIPLVSFVQPEVGLIAGKDTKPERLNEMPYVRGMSNRSRRA